MWRSLACQPAWSEDGYIEKGQQSVNKRRGRKHRGITHTHRKAPHARETAVTDSDHHAVLKNTRLCLCPKEPSNTPIAGGGLGKGLVCFFSLSSRSGAGLHHLSSPGHKVYPATRASDGGRSGCA